jgi:hypothetical protein
MEDAPQAWQVLLESFRSRHLGCWGALKLPRQIHSGKAEDTVDGLVPGVIAEHFGSRRLPQPPAQLRFAPNALECRGQCANIARRDEQTGYSPLD